MWCPREGTVRRSGRAPLSSSVSLVQTEAPHNADCTHRGGLERDPITPPPLPVALRPCRFACGKACKCRLQHHSTRLCILALSPTRLSGTSINILMDTTKEKAAANTSCGGGERTVVKSLWQEPGRVAPLPPRICSPLSFLLRPARKTPAQHSLHCSTDTDAPPDHLPARSLRIVSTMLLYRLTSASSCRFASSMRPPSSVRYRSYLGNIGASRLYWA